MEREVQGTAEGRWPCLAHPGTSRCGGLGGLLRPGMGLLLGEGVGLRGGGLLLQTFKVRGETVSGHLCVDKGLRHCMSFPLPHSWL